MLTIKDLRAGIEGGDILKGVNLDVSRGRIHAVMGPNGSGKSTLAKVLAGDPTYAVTGGSVEFLGRNLLDMKPDERARAGLFLAFQYPSEITGITIQSFLRTALTAQTGKDISVFEFYELLKDRLNLLDLDEAFAGRYLNDGMSGGEKKRTEILQLAVLRPKLAVLDETDSGLDVDALKVVSQSVIQIFEEEKDMSILVITHYQRILSYIKPDFVHVMMDGRIVKSGDAKLAMYIETHGYDSIKAEVEARVSAAG